MRTGRRQANVGKEMTGVTKAAIVLLSLDRDAAAALLREMPADVVERVTESIASLGEIPRTTSREVLAEFDAMREVSRYEPEGGLELAETLLRESFESDDAERVLGHIQSKAQSVPFGFIEQAESGNLLAFIEDEHPQTIALIISHLGHDKAAEILAGLPEPKQVEVVRRVAHMEQTNPDVIEQVERGLEARLASLVLHPVERVGGVDTVAEILNQCDRSTERLILDGVESHEPELVDHIRRLMFVFEDLLLVNDKGIQAVLREIDNDELCLALRTASDELKDKIFSNLSNRAVDLIREDMEYMGPVRLSDVESAQQRIVDVVRRLEEVGELFIASRTDESDIVV